MARGHSLVHLSVNHTAVARCLGARSAKQPRSDYCRPNDDHNSLSVELDMARKIFTGGITIIYEIRTPFVTFRVRRIAEAKCILVTAV